MLRSATDALATAAGAPLYRMPNGAPVSSTSESRTAGPDGPLVLADPHFLEKLAAFDRERVPERVVHAVGTGAYGSFKVTDPYMASICKAAVFKPGASTEVFTRFSLVAPERGAADLLRDVRGFALKFYTPEGNWDLVANNAPVFWIRDPILFPDVVHSQKRNPATNMFDANAFYDFLAAHPESVHLFLLAFGDRGIPASYRTMNGYGNHSFRVTNEAGDAHYVKFHLKAHAGIKSVTSEAAEELRGRDPDFLARDLATALGGPGGPVGAAAWTMFVQAVPEADAPGYHVDIFDVTKVIPHGDYPLREVGTLTLDRLPANFFAEVEQATFSPANLVPGIDASPDRLLQGRVFSYKDTQFHRVGINAHQLPVNAPKAAPHVHNVNRDGSMAVANPGGEPAYHTGHAAATGGPQRVDPGAETAGSWPVGGGGGGGPARVGCYPQDPAAAGKVDDFAQPAAFWRRVLTAPERARLVANIVGHLKDAAAPTQSRMVDVFTRVDAELAQRVQSGLAAAMVGGGGGLPTSGKVPSSHLPPLTEVPVKAGTTILAATDLGGGLVDATAAEAAAAGTGATTVASSLQPRLAGQTGGGQPGPVKGALSALAQGVAALAQGSGHKA